MNKENHVMLKKILNTANVESVLEDVTWMNKNVPERISGWGAANKHAEFLTNKLQANQFTSYDDSYQGYVSYPESGSLEMIVEGKQKMIEAMTFAQSTSTGDEGVYGELVYVGPGGIENYENIDVNGKIALADLSYAPPRPEKTRIATENGAIGIVLINWGDEDNHLIPKGTVK